MIIIYKGCETKFKFHEYDAETFGAWIVGLMPEVDLPQWHLPPTNSKLKAEPNVISIKYNE